MNASRMNIFPTNNEKSNLEVAPLFWSRIESYANKEDGEGPDSTIRTIQEEDEDEEKFQSPSHDLRTSQRPPNQIPR